MILEVQAAHDNTIVVKRYIKDRSEIPSDIIGKACKLFDDDGNEIPLSLKRAKLVAEQAKVEEVKEEPQEQTTTESDDTLEFLKDTKKRGKK